MCCVLHIKRHLVHGWYSSTTPQQWNISKFCILLQFTSKPVLRALSFRIGIFIKLSYRNNLSALGQAHHTSFNSFTSLSLFQLVSKENNYFFSALTELAADLPLNVKGTPCNSAYTLYKLLWQDVLTDQKSYLRSVVITPSLFQFPIVTTISSFTYLKPARYLPHHHHIKPRFCDDPRPGSARNCNTPTWESNYVWSVQLSWLVPFLQQNMKRGSLFFSLTSLPRLWKGPTGLSLQSSPS